jgi:hypothetical protein
MTGLPSRGGHSKHVRPRGECASSRRREIYPLVSCFRSPATHSALPQVRPEPRRGLPHWQVGCSRASQAAYASSSAIPFSPGTETTGRIRPPGKASHSRGLSAGSPDTEPMTPFSLVPAVPGYVGRRAIPQTPLTLNPACNSRNHLHPDDTGYQARANAISPRMLLPQERWRPPPAPVTATADVHHDHGATPAAPVADLLAGDPGQDVELGQPVADAPAQRQTKHQIDAIELLTEDQVDGLLAEQPDSVDYPAISAASSAPSSQQASRSGRPGVPVTLTAGRTARHCRPVAIDSTARTAPPVSMPPCTYRP